MRVLLFTDTANDVNGVARFVRGLGGAAATAQRELTIVTSTRVPVPPGAQAEHIINLEPRGAHPLPGYAHLEIVAPPVRRLKALARRLAPDAIHVSTPGPVGATGRYLARRLGIPLLATYHTDFPAYVAHLFGSRLLARGCAHAMRRFYRPCDTLFVRSPEARPGVEALGLDPARLVTLAPGIDHAAFNPRFRPPDAAALHEFWRGYAGLGVDAEAPKILYVGRVSVEKNLPLLVSAWKQVAGGPGERAAPARPQLVVVGDGPYLPAMRAALNGCQAAFLGFRHAGELSTLYAASDLLVFPSATDTLGQVVMEAQSSGLPVLAADRGGPRGLVNTPTASPLRALAGEASETGVLLPPEDAPAWARQILRLARDAPLRARLGAAGARAMAALPFAASFAQFWSVHERTVAAWRDAAGARTKKGRTF